MHGGTPAAGREAPLQSRDFSAMAASASVRRAKARQKPGRARREGRWRRPSPESRLGRLHGRSTHQHRLARPKLGRKHVRPIDAAHKPRLCQMLQLAARDAQLSSAAPRQTARPRRNRRRSRPGNPRRRRAGPSTVKDTGLTRAPLRFQQARVERASKRQPGVAQEPVQLLAVDAPRPRTAPRSSSTLRHPGRAPVDEPYVKRFLLGVHPERAVDENAASAPHFPRGRKATGASAGATRHTIVFIRVLPSFAIRSHSKGRHRVERRCCSAFS